MAGRVGDHRGAVCRMEFHLREFPACPLPSSARRSRRSRRSCLFRRPWRNASRARASPEVRMRVGRPGQLSTSSGSVAPSGPCRCRTSREPRRPARKPPPDRPGGDEWLPGGASAPAEIAISISPGRGADHQHRDVRCDAAGQHRLGRGGEGNPVGPGLGHGTDTVKRAVPVGIGLQDRTKLHPLIEA